LAVLHREGNGEAELHDVQADVFIVQSGEATLVYGGQVVGGKTTAPNEVRGPSISGGSKVKMGAGDIVHIPAKTAHQVLVESGKQFTYAMVKVDAK
jgi:mannose-6-phosphate isomerase-like protein (cupin superfamily)